MYLKYLNVALFQGEEQRLFFLFLFFFFIKQTSSRKLLKQLTGFEEARVGVSNYVGMTPRQNDTKGTKSALLMPNVQINTLLRVYFVWFMMLNYIQTKALLCNPRF